jgi:hypothetical protein
VAYSVLLVLAVISTIFLFRFTVSFSLSFIDFLVFHNNNILFSFFQLASYISVIAGIYFIIVAGDEFYDEQVAGLSKQSVHWKYIRIFQKHYSLAQALLSKVPDQLELNHR